MTNILSLVLNMKIKFNLNFDLTNAWKDKRKIVYEMDQAKYESEDVRIVSDSLLESIFSLNLKEHVDLYCFCYEVFRENMKVVFVFVVVSNKQYDLLKSKLYSACSISDNVIQDDKVSYEFLKSNMESIIKTHIKYYFKSSGKIISRNYFLLQYIFEQAKHHYYSYTTIDECKLIDAEIQFSQDSLESKSSQTSTISSRPASQTRIEKSNVNHRSKSMVNTIQLKLPPKTFQITVVFKVGILKYRFVESVKEESKYLDKSGIRILEMRFLSQVSNQMQDISYRPSVASKKTKGKKKAEEIKKTQYKVVNMPTEIEFRSKVMAPYSIYETLNLVDHFFTKEFNNLTTGEDVSIITSRCDKLFYDNRLNYITDDSSESLSRNFLIMDQAMSKPVDMKTKIKNIFDEFVLLKDEITAINYFKSVVFETANERQLEYVNYEESLLSFFNHFISQSESVKNKLIDQKAEKIFNEFMDQPKKETNLKSFDPNDILTQSDCKTDFGNNNENPKKLEKLKRETIRNREKSIKEANIKLVNDIRSEVVKLGFLQEKKPKITFAIPSKRDNMVKAIRNLTSEF